MGDFLKSRTGKVLVTALVSAGLYMACAKFPVQAGALAALATAVAAAMPSALASNKPDEPPAP